MTTRRELLVATLGASALAYARVLRAQSTSGCELGGKRVQLLKQAPPRIIRVGVLRNPSSSAIANEQKLIVQAAATLGISVTPVLVKQGDDLEGRVRGAAEASD